MADAPARYFELKTHVGDHPEEPLSDVTFNYSTPTIVGGEVVKTTQTRSLRDCFMPDHPRVLKIDSLDFVALDFIAGPHGEENWQEIDPPKTEQPRKPKASADTKE